MSERESGFAAVRPRRAEVHWGLFKFTYDPDMGAIYSDGTDWAILSGAALRRIYEDTLSILGEEKGKDLWYSIGVHLGENIHEYYEEQGISGHPLEQLAAALERFGWGNLEVHESEMGDSAHIVVAGSVFTRGAPRFSCPVCDMIGGVFGGYFEREMGTKGIKFTETACDITGAGRCRFETRLPRATM